MKLTAMPQASCRRAELSERERFDPLTSRFEHERADSAVQRPDELAVRLLSTRVSFHQDDLSRARIRNLQINQIKRE